MAKRVSSPVAAQVNNAYAAELTKSSEAPAVVEQDIVAAPKVRKPRKPKVTIAPVAEVAPEPVVEAPEPIPESVVEAPSEVTMTKSKIHLKAKDRYLVFSGLNANTHENIFVHALSFKRDDQGVILKQDHPWFPEPVEILDVSKLNNYKLEMSSNTPLFSAWKAGQVRGTDRITIFSMNESSNDHEKLYQLLCYNLLREALQPDGTYSDKLRFPIFNPKKGQPHLVVGNRVAWQEVFGGDEIYCHENPLKIFPLIAGNTAFEWNPKMTKRFNKGSAPPTHIRVLIGPSEYTVEHPVAPGRTIAHDGCIFLKVLTKVCKRTSNPELPESYFTVYGSQARCTEPGLIKAKFHCDHVAMLDAMKRNGFDGQFDQVDGYASKDILKGWSNQDFRPGDIIELDLLKLRLVAAKLSDGNSSIGGQADARLDSKSTESLLIEHGTAGRAKILRGVIEGRAEDFEIILRADKDNSLGDNVKEYIQYLCYSTPHPKLGWKVPYYESAWNHALARMLSFYWRDVIKCRVAKLSLYVQVDMSLDKAEEDHFLKTGERVNFVLPPKKAKMRSIMLAHKYLNIGRNPMVGPGNCQGVKFLLAEDGGIRHNHTNDTICISARFLFSMFGDEDGDSIIIVPSNTVFFPCIRRPAGEAEGWKSKYVPMEERLKMTGFDVMMKLLDCTRFTVQAGVDTGRVDLASRLISIVSRLMGKPLDVPTLLSMAEYCENAIQKMKRKDAKSAQADQTSSDAVISLENAFWPHDFKLPRGKDAPREHRLLAQTVGIGMHKRDGEYMTAIIDLLSSAIGTNKGVPHHVAWDELRGVQPSMDHQSSEEIRRYFVEIWEGVQLFDSAGRPVRNALGQITYRADRPGLINQLGKGYYDYVVPSEPTEEHKLSVAISYLKYIDQYDPNFTDGECLSKAAHLGLDFSALEPSRRITTEEVEAAIAAEGKSLLDYEDKDLYEMMDAWVPFSNPGAQVRQHYGYTAKTAVGIATDICKYYDKESKNAMAMTDNHDRRMAFNTLRVKIRAAVEEFVPEMPEGGYAIDKWGMTIKDLYYRAVTCYVGTLGFGLWAGNRKDPRTGEYLRDEYGNMIPFSGSKPGSAFYYLPERHLIDYAHRRNPNNPWAIKAQRELIILRKKALQAEQRAAERMEEDDDYADYMANV